MERSSIFLAFVLKFHHMGIEGAPKVDAARVARRLINKIDRGDEVMSKRIHETLSIDSDTRPTLEEVEDFVKQERERRLNARKHSRKA